MRVEFLAGEIAAFFFLPKLFEASCLTDGADSRSATPTKPSPPRMLRVGSAVSWRERAAAVYEPMSSLSDLAFDMEFGAGTPGLRMDECVLHAHLTEHELEDGRAAWQHEGPAGAPRAQLFAEETPAVAAAERTTVEVNAIVTGDGRRRERGGDMDSLDCVVEALSHYHGAYAHKHSFHMD
jgi:hypothetical protein